MAGPHRVRDNTLIDALESISATSFKGTVWRVVREGRDALMGSAAGGRWDDGTFDVLYTSLTADGAIAEMHFHLSRGLPVIPSRVHYRLFELRASIARAVRLADLASIAGLGANISRYGALSYVDRQQEYPRTQDIAETAHFVGFDGLIVPNARWDCLNAVLFCDRAPSGASELVRDHGRIDWTRWKKTPLGF
jgi:RES domain-containing protein